MASERLGTKPQIQSPLTWLKWLIVLLVVMYSGYMVVSMYLRGDVAFPLLIVVLVASGVVIFLNKRTYAHRYAFPAIAGMITFIIFPMLYTISIAFTNYSGDHTLTVDRAMKYHLDKVYRRSDDQSGGGAYLFKLVIKPSSNPQSSVKNAQIYLQKEDESKALFVSDSFTIKTSQALKDQANIPVTRVNLSEWNGPNDNHCKTAEGEDIPFDECLKDLHGIATPKEVNVDYKVALDHLSLNLTDLGVQLQKTKFKEFEAVSKKYDRVVMGAMLPSQRMLSGKYLLQDNETGKYFMPDDEVGYYRYVDDAGRPIGDNYVPGFKVNVGFKNFATIANDEGVRKPFIKIFIWTVVFAFLTVFITLAIGMVLACLVQWEFLKGRSIYRLFLVLPYAVPAFISILVFRGLFNESYGEINAIIKGVAGMFMDTSDYEAIPWFNSPMWAKSMILIVNAWLGYPYMMILCMGLLKSIPDDLYEASAMDGASFVGNFFKITLPLLIKPLTPLLIASFAFNFNNFVLIQLLTNGSPDILDANPQAGETDLLVSYTYRIAFQGNGGQNYGLAAAIATLIFLLVGAIAIVQLWFTRRLAEEKPIA